MSRSPKTIDLFRGAGRKRQRFLCSSFGFRFFFVVDKSSAHPKRPVGLIHLQDLLAAGIL